MMTALFLSKNTAPKKTFSDKIMEDWLFISLY
jgi:hypothetical protein